VISVVLSFRQSVSSHRPPRSRYGPDLRPYLTSDLSASYSTDMPEALNGKLSTISFVLLVVW